MSAPRTPSFCQNLKDFSQERATRLRQSIFSNLQEAGDALKPASASGFRSRDARIRPLRLRQWGNCAWILPWKRLRRSNLTINWTSSFKII